MKTIKIIDLLNLVYEEKAPNKVIYVGREYKFNQTTNDYEDKNGSELFSYLFQCEEEALFKVVEIIEDTDELKKIDKLSYQQIGSWSLEQHDYVEYARAVDKQISQIGNKINELTEALNYLLKKDKED